TNPTDSDDLAVGGELTIGLTTLPDDWNPWLLDWSDLPQPIDALTARFFTTDADGDFLWNPDWLAAEPQVTSQVTPQGRSNGMTVRLRLNPAAVWGDGVPLGIDDFRATWQACLGRTDPLCHDRHFDQVTAIDQASSGEIVIVYAQGIADWPVTFARGPMRAQALPDWTDRLTSWPSAVGRMDAFSGAWTLAGASPSQIDLQVNPAWWGVAPALETIHFQLYAADDVTLAYVRGDLDALWIDDANVYSQLTALKRGALRRGDGRRARLIELNTAATTLSQGDVRRALWMALDRADLAQADLAGLSWSTQLLNSPLWLPGQSLYRDLTKDADQSIIEPLDQGLSQAGELLDDLGWSWPTGEHDQNSTEQLFRSRDGQELSLHLVYDPADPMAENEAFALRRQWLDLGVNLTIEAVDATSWQTKPATIDWDLRLVRLDHPSDLAVAKRYTTAAGSGYVSSAVDIYYQQAVSQLDDQRRAARLDRLAEAVWHDMPVIPLYVESATLLAPSDLANYGPSGLVSIQWNLVGWAI
ncbi:MAG: ABC transporter substrate-binding protein, partial [Propionibacteriaceae bacterium]|nr:ABC transporter substrate-binding protein [Propionibacteriaceae bacterium]